MLNARITGLVIENEGLRGQMGQLQLENNGE